MTQAVQIRIDKDLKDKAEKALESLGLDLPTAIRIFLTKVVATHSIPFELKNEFPSDFLVDSIIQTEKDKRNGTLKTFKDVNSAISFLDTL
jgi:DNA-damage-inducible protein J